MAFVIYLKYQCHERQATVRLRGQQTSANDNEQQRFRSLRFVHSLRTRLGKALPFGSTKLGIVLSLANISRQSQSALTTLLMTAPLIVLLFQKAFVVFATLTPIINAPGMAPIFLTLTDGLSIATRSKVARQIAFSGFLLVVGSVLIGSPLLAFFGVSLSVCE